MIAILCILVFLRKAIKEQQLAKLLRGLVPNNASENL